MFFPIFKNIFRIPLLYQRQIKYLKFGLTPLQKQKVVCYYVKEYKAKTVCEKHWRMVISALFLFKSAMEDWINNSGEFWNFKWLRSQIKENSKCIKLNKHALTEPDWKDERITGFTAYHKQNNNKQTKQQQHQQRRTAAKSWKYCAEFLWVFCDFYIYTFCVRFIAVKTVRQLLFVTIYCIMQMIVHKLFKLLISSRMNIYSYISWLQMYNNFLYMYTHMCALSVCCPWNIIE